jgi:hypothetical protein
MRECVAFTSDRANIGQSCGDVLFGDYVERTQGSLQALAVQLGGRVVSGPASLVGGSPSFASSVTTPYPTGLSEQTHESQQASGSIQDSSAMPQSSTNAHQMLTHRASAAIIGTPQATTHRWLELCIRSSPNTYTLGELDIAGTPTDMTVFSEIRKKYQHFRNTRILNYFDARIPNGGIFVQVCG